MSKITKSKEKDAQIAEKRIVREELSDVEILGVAGGTDIIEAEGLEEYEGTTTVDAEGFAENASDKEGLSPYLKKKLVRTFLNRT